MHEAVRSAGWPEKYQELCWTVIMVSLRLMTQKIQAVKMNCQKINTQHHSSMSHRNISTDNSLSTVNTYESLSHHLIFLRPIEITISTNFRNRYNGKSKQIRHRGYLFSIYTPICYIYEASLQFSSSSEAGSSDPEPILCQIYLLSVLSNSLKFSCSCKTLLPSLLPTNSCWYLHSFY